ncbi:hypothetical protein [Streptacidiphilus sp. EB129]|uniref:hypothetical protein n=1 Tax=Streptacidiphilus sp. EB129 TaxID=3156262 RepID=UPI003514564A
MAGAGPLRVLALDPRAPDAVRDLVAADGWGGGWLPEPPSGGPGPLCRAGLRLAGVVLMVAALQIVDQVRPVTPGGPDAVARLVHRAVGAAHWAAWGTASLMLAMTLTKTLAALFAWRGEVTGRRAVTGARPYLVLEDEVDPAAVRLLDRAQAAAATVLGSGLHAEDLLDRQRGNTVVPAEVWAIAQALRDNTRLAGRGPGQVEHRARQLAQAGAAVAGRVEALEEYARAVRRADAGYRRWQQTQEPGDDPQDDAARLADEDAVLEVLAASAGHQVAARELRAMTDKAVELAEVLDSRTDRAPE